MPAYASMDWIQESNLFQQLEYTVQVEENNSQAIPILHFAHVLVNKRLLEIVHLFAVNFKVDGRSDKWIIGG